MLKRRHPNSRRAAKANTVPGYLQYVRGFVCCVPGCDTGARIQTHHIRKGTNTAAGVKPHDRHAVPMCAIHHSKYHDDGHQSFERNYGIDLMAIANQLWRSWPKRWTYERENEERF